MGRRLLKAVEQMSGDEPLMVACIPAFNEERAIGGVVVRAVRFVDGVVVCDDWSVDLTGAIAEGLEGVAQRHECEELGK